MSKAIDKAAGARRDRVAVPVAAPTEGIYGEFSGEIDGPDPVTAAAAWQGWGSALKPAHEPIVLARKPLSGTVAETVLAHGTGALNIAASAVGAETTTTVFTGHKPLKPSSYSVQGGAAKASIEHDSPGRWPANVLLAHLPECKGSGAAHTDVLCAEGCPVRELNEASGESTCPPFVVRGAKTRVTTNAPTREANQVYPGHGDSGGAARFFYVAKPRTRERVGGTIRNLHPTVKPIDLMRYLVRLVTPPGGIVLDPFLGSGTTGCAAMVEGFRFVGVERDEESFETSVARVSDYAFAHGRARPETS